MVFTTGRFSLYALLSFAAAYAVVSSALSSRPSLYSAIIYLTTNKAAIIALTNATAVVFILIGMVVKSIFLGPLKPAEIERVSETLRFTIPEVCLALTIFREELSLRIFGLFAILLFSKFFHAVADERSSDIESNGLGTLHSLQHIRFVSLLSVMILGDILCIIGFTYVLSTSGHSVLILFAFEYSLMLLDVLRVCFRYGVALLASRIRMEYHDRSLYLLYGKLLIDTIKLAVYTMYFIILFAYYGMPIIIIREVYKAFADVSRELQNVVAARRLRKQVHVMPQPTVRDIEEHDPTCSVCMVEVTAADLTSAKILSCKHILHTTCLLQWTQRQRICPMCRADINEMVATPARPPAAAAERTPAPPPAQAPQAPPTQPARTEDAARGQAAERPGEIRSMSTQARAHPIVDEPARDQNLTVQREVNPSALQQPPVGPQANGLVLATDPLAVAHTVVALQQYYLTLKQLEQQIIAGQTFAVAPNPTASPGPHMPNSEDEAPREDVPDPSLRR